jgi:uncharacterized protein (TIGR03437 family)
MRRAKQESSMLRSIYVALRIAAASLLLSCAFSASLNAQPVVVTFNDLPENRFFNNGGQNVGAFYRGFSIGPNVTALSSARFSGYNSSGYPPRSGDVVIWDSRDAAITVSFASAITSFGIWYSSFVPVSLQAFDQNGLLLGSVDGGANSNGINGTSMLLSTDRPGMRTVKIIGSPGLFTISSLIYEGLVAPQCTYALSAGGQEFPASAGSTTINISAPAGCVWNVSTTSVPNWIQFVGATSGSGDGTITIQIQSNSGALRTATLTIAERPFNITQLAATGPTPGPTPAATAAGVLNAASYQGGAVAPGQIVTIFGSDIGPPSIALLELDAQSRVNTQVGQTRVLFDGVPAPVVYALASQTTVIVPYAVAGKSSTQMVIEYQGRQSPAITLQVVPTAPGLFSANASGSGGGAILNHDFSLNTTQNPESKGSFIILFGTGEGQTNPSGVDGSVASTIFPTPQLPVNVTIGGVPARVLYAGAAPGLVAGVLQVNAEIAPNTPSGIQPVVVRVGSASSQGGLTVAIAGTTPAPQ